MPGAFDDLIPATPSRVPSLRPVGPMIPKAPTPDSASELERLRLAQQAAAREAAKFAERNQPTLKAGYRWKDGVVGGTAEPIPGIVDDGAKPTEYQTKSAGFLGRMLRAEQQFNAVPEGSRDPRTYFGQALHDTAPSVQNSLPVWLGGNSSARQIADAAALDFVRASLRQESGASINPDEEVKQYQMFFPMPGNTADTLKAKAAARAQAIQGFRIAAGPLAQQIEKTVQAPVHVEEDGARDNAAIVDYMANQRFNAGNYHADAPLTAEQDKQYHAFLLTKPSPDQIKAFGKQQFDIDVGNADELAKYYREGGTGYGGVEPKPLTLEQEADVQRQMNEGPGPISLGAGRAVTAEFLDEAGSALDATGDAFAGKGSWKDRYDYNLGVNRAVLRRQGEESSPETGLGMVLGGLAVPYGASAKTPAELARVGAIYGGLSGIGSGQTTTGRIGGGIAGAVTGGALGYGGGLAAPYLARGASAVANKLGGSRALPAGAQNVIDASVAENVPIARPFVDRTLANKVRGLEATRGGNGPVREGLANASDAIEARVGNLAGSGNALGPYEGGTAIQAAGKEYIKRSKNVVDRLYDRARAAVPEGLEIQPSKAVQAIDANIAELSKAPAQNRALIRYFEDMKSDMIKQPVNTGVLDASGKPIMRAGEGLSIDTLRSMRTNMRGNISERNLTFTDAERRTKAILDAASRDIEEQLVDNAPVAGARFVRADKAFRAKQNKIERGMKPFLGPREQNIPAETAFTRFEAMAKLRGNRDALESIWKEIDPSTADDFRATFAEPLGRDEVGDFSPKEFIKHAARLSPSARRTIFGNAGAESINNLVKLAGAYRKVTNSLNTSGSGAALNWRNSIGQAMGFGVTAVPAFASGAGAAGSFILGAAGAAASRAARDQVDRLSARALMSTDLTKWAVNASNATNPAAIQVQINRLTTLAARNPAISNEVLGLQQRLADAFAASPARLAANEGNDGRNPVNRGQRNGDNNRPLNPSVPQHAPQSIGAPR